MGLVADFFMNYITYRASEKPIAFHPDLARAFGSVNTALYLQQLMYWSDKGGREDGYIYKTKDDIEVETCLTVRQQDVIRKDLERRGVLTTKLIKVNGAPTLHYKVDFGILQNVIMEYYKMSESNVTKCQNLTYTENTTESTTNILKKEINKEKKFSKIEDIQNEDITLIAEKYSVPESFVRSKLDDLANWLGEKPTRGRGRNLRMTLMNWVKRDALSIRENHAKSTSKNNRRVAVFPQE